MPDPELLQPLALVLVTVYVPAVVTVINAPVAPVLHNNGSLPVVDNFEVPQLFNTVTITDGIAFGEDTPLPIGLAQPSTVLFTVIVPAVVTVMEGVVAPVLHNMLPPSGIDKTELPQLF